MPDDIERSSIEGTLWGQRIKVSGRDAIYILLLAAFSAGVAYLLYERADTLSGNLSGQTTLFRQDHDRILFEQGVQHKEIRSGLQDLTDAIDRQTYVSTLSPQQKVALNERLKMPPSLRKLMRDE